VSSPRQSCICFQHKGTDSDRDSGAGSACIAFDVPSLEQQPLGFFVLTTGETTVEVAQHEILFVEQLVATTSSNVTSIFSRNQLGGVTSCRLAQANFS